MNQLAHFFITYFILSFLFEDLKKYLIPVIVFSIILDLDHLPGYVKYAYIGKRARGKLKTRDYVDMYRTAVQEPIGVFVILSFIAALFMFGVKEELLVIAGLCILIHWVIDFLTVHTRPFSPFSDRIVVLFFNTMKERKQSEVIITIISFALFSYIWF